MDPKPSPVRRGLTCALLLLAFGIAPTRFQAGAHDSLAAYIQHRVAITVGARHTDLTVQLTFFEEQSEHEREQMDANGDGRLSPSELAAYLKQSQADTAKGLTLRMGGQVIPTTPLRPPEIDLLSQPQVGRGHFRLTLYFFASTPTDLPVGAEIEIEDRLWPTVRALGSIQAAGRDGCRIEPFRVADPLFPPAKSNEARLFKAGVVSPPAEPKKKPAHTAVRQP